MLAKTVRAAATVAFAVIGVACWLVATEEEIKPRHQRH